MTSLVRAPMAHGDGGAGEDRGKERKCESERIERSPRLARGYGRRPAAQSAVWGIGGDASAFEPSEQVAGWLTGGVGQVSFLHFPPFLFPYSLSFLSVMKLLLKSPQKFRKNSGGPMRLC